MIPHGPVSGTPSGPLSPSIDTSPMSARPRWLGSLTNRFPLAASAQGCTWKTHGDDAGPGVPKECRPVCCRTKRPEPAGHGHRSSHRGRLCRPWSIRPHMATGLPHPWHIRPMAEPLRPGQNSRCERGMWTAAVNAACHVVRVRCHDRETTPWRSRSQARGHVRQTGQDGGGVASQARISGRGAPAPIHGEPNNRNHPFLCKNRTWSIDIRPARTKLSRCRAASDWVPANQPGPPGCRPATLSRR